jgi:hypothetical protein
MILVTESSRTHRQGRIPKEADERTVIAGVLSVVEILR